MKDKELATLLSEKAQREITVDMLRRQRRNLKIRKKRGRPHSTEENTENKGNKEA